VNVADVLEMWCISGPSMKDFHAIEPYS